MNRIYYRYSVIKAEVAVADVGIADRIVSGGYAKANDIIGGGYTFKSTPIKSLNSAIATAMAMCRRFQSGGQDCVIKVYGQVFDTNNLADRTLSGLPDDNRPRPTNRVRELQISGNPPLDEAREQQYASIDTPNKDLTHVINLSNRDSTGGGAVDLSLNTTEAD